MEDQNKWILTKECLPTLGYCESFTDGDGFGFLFLTEKGFVHCGMYEVGAFRAFAEPWERYPVEKVVAWRIVDPLPYYVIEKWLNTKGYKDALEIKQQQLSEYAACQLMTEDEMMFVAKRNEKFLCSDEQTEFVWLEERCRNESKLVCLVNSYHPEWGDINSDEKYTASYIGTDITSRFKESEYGKTWRCWTSCPTKAQKEGVKWK